MKLKRRGYILFVYWSGNDPYFEVPEFCENMKRLLHCHNSHYDDKWDVDGRNKYQYFYLDIAKNKYIPLPKWKDDFVPSLVYEQSKEMVLSTKTF